ncbi:MAG: nickel-dependent lactate racemase [Anaerolineales bacterium]|nr:nickel-dependent lactate racemase [Anaerolineales bacterium]
MTPPTRTAHLSYGRGTLPVAVPADAAIFEMQPVPGLADEAAAIRAALRQPTGAPPLAEWLRPGQTVAVVHSDITRATPNDRLLPVLLEDIEAAGIRPHDITLINGLGTHRPQTEAELRAMLGDRIVERYRCTQHNAFDDAALGPLPPTQRGHPVRLNRTFMEADARIVTGLIEPHFFAGFSGGPKGLLPALAGQESVLTNHSHAMIAHPAATWGVTDGNPIWEEMREVALRAAPLFLLNVTLNAAKQITGVFAGDLLAAHTAGCDFLRQSVMVTVDAPFDIVLTTNSGYPLDQNLYQAVKGMSAAGRIVRPGGAIVMCAACADGVPSHGQYARLLAEAGSPAAMLARLAQPGFSAPDQWQAQIQAKLQQQAEVFVYSDGLTDEQIRGALFTPCRDLPATLAMLLRRYGPHARVAVLPDGPQVIATLRAEAVT